MRKIVFLLCALLAAGSLNGCAGGERPATEPAGQEAPEAENTGEEAEQAEQTDKAEETPAADQTEETAAFTGPDYARNRHTLIRNAYDGKTFCYFGDRVVELPGETQDAFHAGMTNGTVIRTAEGVYLFKDGEITDTGYRTDEVVVPSPEADAFLLFASPEQPLEGLTGYPEVFLLEGETRIPLFEADGSRFMISGSWSPDGSHYIYTLYDTDDEAFTVYLFDGASSEEIMSDTAFISVIKVSNDGSTAYLRSNQTAADGTMELYAVTNGQVASCGPFAGDAFFFSYDGSDLIYSDGTDMKLSIAGGTPSVLEGEYRYIAPQNSIASTHVNTVGAGTFLNTFYYDEAAECVCRINASGEAEVCIENVSSNYLLTEDAKTLLYTGGDALYRADMTSASVSPEKIVEDEVLFFTASRDASAIAYVDGEKRLMLKKGDDEPVCIAEQVKRTREYQKQNDNPWYGCVVYLQDRDLFGYLDNGVLCFTGDGKTVDEKADLSGEAVYLFSVPGYLAVYTDENGTIRQYFSSDGDALHEVVSE